MTKRDDLLAAVHGALELVRAETQSLPRAENLAMVEPLGSLLEQCRAWQAAEAACAPEPIRTLHHFACTGGTPISKCLAVMPNTRLLSEIAPLSQLGAKNALPRFSPSDLVYHLKTGLRPVEDRAVLEVFLAGLRVIYRQCRARGEHLVLRDHSHSQFCDGTEIHHSPLLKEIVAEIAPVRAALTVRHPVASFLSLARNGWEHYAPKGLNEYCRRYEAFLDAHQGLPIYRYEDFVADPQTVLRALCDTLDLPWSNDAVEVFSVARLTGDSGRGGSRIAKHPPRTADGSFFEMAQASDSYRSLCARLGYGLTEER